MKPPNAAIERAPRRVALRWGPRRRGGVFAAVGLSAFAALIVLFALMMVCQARSAKDLLVAVPFACMWSGFLLVPIWGIAWSNWSVHTLALEEETESYRGKPRRWFVVERRLFWIVRRRRYDLDEVSGIRLDVQLGGKGARTRRLAFDHRSKTVYATLSLRLGEGSYLLEQLRDFVPAHCHTETLRLPPGEV